MPGLQTLLGALSFLLLRAHTFYKKSCETIHENSCHWRTLPTPRGWLDLQTLMDVEEPLERSMAPGTEACTTLTQYLKSEGTQLLNSSTLGWRARPRL